MAEDRETSTSTAEQLAAAAAGSPYPLDAFILVWEVVSHIARSPHGKRHVTAEQICWSLLDYAVQLYGKKASRQLADWGIVTCSDIGRISQRLVETKVFETSEADSLGDFDALPDFQEELRRAASPMLYGLRQWKLSTLFVFTTIIAVVFAGFSRLGVAGAIQTLLGAWVTMIGSFWLVNLRRDASSVGIFAFMLISASIFVIIGVWIFLSTILLDSW